MSERPRNLIAEAGITSLTNTLEATFGETWNVVNRGVVSVRKNGWTQENPIFYTGTLITVHTAHTDAAYIGMIPSNYYEMRPCVGDGKTDYAAQIVYVDGLGFGIPYYDNDGISWKFRKSKAEIVAYCEGIREYALHQKQLELSVTNVTDYTDNTAAYSPGIEFVQRAYAKARSGELLDPTDDDTNQFLAIALQTNSDVVAFYDDGLSQGMEIEHFGHRVRYAPKSINEFGETVWYIPSKSGNGWNKVSYEQVTKFVKTNWKAR